MNGEVKCRITEKIWSSEWKVCLKYSILKRIGLPGRQAGYCWREAVKWGVARRGQGCGAKAKSRTERYQKRGLQAICWVYKGYWRQQERKTVAVLIGYPILHERNKQAGNHDIASKIYNASWGKSNRTFNTSRFMSMNWTRGNSR